jgi:hypothetical protein
MCGEYNTRALTDPPRAPMLCAPPLHALPDRKFHQLAQNSNQGEVISLELSMKLQLVRGRQSCRLKVKLTSGNQMSRSQRVFVLARLQPLSYNKPRQHSQEWNSRAIVSHASRSQVSSIKIGLSGIKAWFFGICVDSGLRSVQSVSGKFSGA